MHVDSFGQWNCTIYVFDWRSVVNLWSAQRMFTISFDGLTKMNALYLSRTSSHFNSTLIQNDSLSNLTGKIWICDLWLIRQRNNDFISNWIDKTDTYSWWSSGAQQSNGRRLNTIIDAALISKKLHLILISLLESNTWEEQIRFNSNRIGEWLLEHCYRDIINEIHFRWGHSIEWKSINVTFFRISLVKNIISNIMHINVFQCSLDWMCHKYYKEQS